MHRKGRQGFKYDFTVRKQRVMASLLYKIQIDPYYQDVRVDYNVVEELPKNATYISHMLNYGQTHASNQIYMCVCVCVYTHIFGRYL